MPEGIIWIGDKPAATLERGGVHLTLRSSERVCTFRMLPEIAREMCSGVLFLLDEQARKPSNVRPFRKRG